MNTTKFAPGSVSPEQLEEYRQQYEAAKVADKEAYNLYQETYRAWWDKSTLLKEAELVYTWAKRSMVREPAE